jgi:signal transduction histidine kinase
MLQLDFVLMEQALRNILHNANTYTPENAEIQISAQKIEDTVTIIIKDNGPGLPKDNPAKVFEKFYRVQGIVTGGTGLGLTITKSIIELHGGKITAANEDLGGARFTIELPLNSEPS